MIRDGYYSVTYATLLGEGAANVRIERGVVSGETDRGTALGGTIQFDPSRRMLQFEISATVPAQKVSITGLSTGDRSRRVMFKGETPAKGDNTRFSIDFAGRAVDIVARYTGPLETGT
jgi:hypothetical protein